MEYTYPLGRHYTAEELTDSYQDLFFSEEDRPIGQYTYDDLFNDPVLFPLQRKNELAFMMQEAQLLAPKIVMEIGAGKGGGIYHWCKCLPSVTRVIACEPRGIPYKNQFEEAFLRIAFLWIESWCRDTVSINSVASWLEPGEGIDCLFIDGDKRNVLSDVKAYAPFMTDGGVIFIHDVNGGPPKIHLSALEGLGYSVTVFIETSESKIALERESNDLPPETVYEQWLRYWKGSSAGLAVLKKES